MSEERVKLLEKQVEDLQARLNEATAKYAKVDAENRQLHRTFLREVELRHRLEAQLVSGPCFPPETAPTAGRERRAAPQQGLFAARGPLFGDEQLETRAENRSPDNHSASLGAGLGGGLVGGLGTSIGRGASQLPESLILTPPQEVPQRRERAGAARSLNGAFDGAGTAGGGGLSQGMLERLSQEADVREEFLGSGSQATAGGVSGTQIVNRQSVGRAANGVVSGQTQFGELGINSGVTRGVATTTGVKLENASGGANASANLGVPAAGQGLGGGVGHEFTGGLGNGLGTGMGAGAVAGFGSLFDQGAQGAAALQDDQDSVATQVVEEGAESEVNGHWGGGAFQGNPLLGNGGGGGDTNRAQNYASPAQAQGSPPLWAPQRGQLSQQHMGGGLGQNPRGGQIQQQPGVGGLGQNWQGGQIQQQQGGGRLGQHPQGAQFQQQQGWGGPSQDLQGGAQGFPGGSQVQRGTAGGVSGKVQAADCQMCSACGSAKVVELTAKKGQNAGKRFYKCEDCNKFLKWKDSAAAPGTPPRPNAQLSPGPQAGFPGSSFSPPSRGQKRPWGQSGGRGSCPCGGQGVTEHVTGKNGPNKGRKYLKCATCDKWLRWND